MRLRLFAALGATLALGGCSLMIDPGGVPPPNTCVATGCLGKACGYDDCGTVCAVGSGCEVTHSVRGGLVGGGGRTASATHAVQGELVPAGGSSTAASGHSVKQGTLSR